MPIYQIEGLDGKVYRIEGPDGLAREQVMAEVLRRAPQAGRAPAPKPEGFFANVGQLIKESVPAAVEAYKLGPSVLAGSVPVEKAGAISKQLSAERTTPPELQAAQEAFKDEAAAFEKAKGFVESVGPVGQMVLELGRQVLTNPKGAVYLTAQSAAQTVPVITAMLAGSAAGSPLGPVGSAAGAVTGAFGAGAIGESGAEFVNGVQRALQADGLPPTEANVAKIISDIPRMQKIAEQARAKGATTAAVEAAFTGGSGRVITAPARNAIRLAQRELGEAATEAQVKARAADILSQRTLGQKVGRGTVAGAIDVVGGGVAEAAGQQAGYGKVDLTEVGLETLGGLGSSVVEVPAAAISMGRERLPTAQPAPATPQTPPAEQTPQDEFATTDDADEGPATLGQIESVENLAARLEARGDTATAKDLREQATAARAKVEREQANTQAEATVASLDTMDYESMAKARAALEAAPKTAKTTSAVNAITARMRAQDAQRIEAARRGEALAQESAFGAAEPDLFGRVYPPAPEPEAAPAVEEPQLRVQDPRQMDLLEPLRAPATPEGAIAQAQPDLFGMVYPPAPEPQAEVEPQTPPRPDLRADALQMPLDLRARRERRVTVPEPQGAQDVAAIEQPAAEPAGGGIRPEQSADTGTAEPGMAAPVELAGQPDAPDTAGAVAPERAGVAPVPRDVGGYAEPAGPDATAVTPETPVEEAPVEEAPAAPPSRPSAFTIPSKSQLLMEQEAAAGGGRRVRGTRYRTPEAQPAPAQPIQDAELRRVVASVQKALDLPDLGVNILDSVQQFDPRQEAGRRAGALGDNGQIYLFRDGIPGGVEGQKTIFHELLHRGLRNLLPQGEYFRTLHRLYLQSAQVRSLADAWLDDAGNMADVRKLTEDPVAQKAIAVDEVLADMAEQRKLPGTVRQIGNWLANLAARLGMPALARSIRTMGMKPLEAFIDDALRAAGTAPAPQAGGTRFRTAKEQTAQAKEVDRRLAALDRAPVTEPTRMQQATAALRDAKENPRAAAQTFNSATSRFLDTIGNKLFSSNFAFTRAIRKQLEGQIRENPQAMGMLLSITDAQADASAIVAGLHLKNGRTVYNPELYKFESKDGTSMYDVGTSISEMAKKHGLTPERANRVVHTFFEARRTKDLLKRNADLESDAQVLEAAGYKKKAADFRAKIVKGLESEAWVDAALQFEQMFPELTKIADQWNEVRKNTSELMVASGLWTPEEAENLLEAATYAPFFREGQIEEGKGPKEYISGFRVAAKEKRLKGSDREIADIFDNMVRWTQFAVERAVRNHMAVVRADAAVQFGLGEQVSIDAKDVPNPVKIWRDGKQEQYSMRDPLFADSFQGLESVALPVLGVFSKFTNLLRQSVVLNPLFGALQVPQDAIAAIYTSGLRPRYAFTIPARAVKEFLHTLVSPDTNKVHQELRRFGAVGAQDVTANVIRTDLDIMEGAKAAGALPQRIGRTVLKGLHHVAMASDAAVRQAVYQASLDQGLSQAEALEKSFQLINFRNHGTSKTLALAARVIPFLNAYMAAQHVAYKTLSGTGISPTDRKAALETLAYTTAGMMTLAVLYAMLNGDDEGYEKHPLYRRDRVFVIPGTGGMAIPMRSDVFAFPKVFAEHMWHHITDSGTLDGANTRRSMKDLAVNAIAAPHLPQFLKPAVEVAINYDFFRNRPLVGSNLADAATEYQYVDSTSELAKSVGRTGLISPIAFDHLMRGYLGSLGGLTLYMTNAMGNSLNGTPRPDMDSWDAIASFPGAGLLLPKSTDSAMRADFYELKEATDRVVRTVSALNGRNPQELERYLAGEDVMNRAALAPAVNAVYRDILEIRKAISQVRNNTQLSGADKQAQIKELQEIELQIYQSIGLREMRRAANL